MLFSNFIRTDDQIIRANESEFDFLERCAWPSAASIRLLLEQCLKNYPLIEQAEIIARIRSGDKRHFTSAIFELFLHEYMIRQGFILTPHPELPNGSLKRPDFLVSDSDGQLFYLEAVCTSENDGKDSSAEARKNWALDYINLRPHHSFMIAIESTGDPTTQPSGKQLYKFINQWL
ncbi:hypothetical protein OHW61_04145, partial [Acinetobacter baumannii]|nr:hypothetical protein [Acinetobacter baumannii]